MFRGDGESLESNQAANSTSDNPTGGGAFMDRQQNVSGQLWKLEKVGAIQNQTSAPTTTPINLNIGTTASFQSVQLSK